MDICKVDYSSWLQQVKEMIQTSQLRAALRVNRELLRMYWLLGKEILEKEKTAEWGANLIDRLPGDLICKIPMARGLSRINLYRIRSWVSFYSENETIGHDMPEALLQVPWKYHIEIVERCHVCEEALFYINEAWKNGWDYDELVQNINNKVWEQQPG